MASTILLLHEAKEIGLDCAWVCVDTFRHTHVSFVYKHME